MEISLVEIVIGVGFGRRKGNVRAGLFKRRELVKTRIVAIGKVE